MKKVFLLACGIIALAACSPKEETQTPVPQPQIDADISETVD